MDDYSCSNRKHIAESKVERYLTENIARLMREYIVRSEVQVSSTELHTLEKEIASLKTKLSRLNDIYLDGNMEKDAYYKKTAQLKTELKHLTDRNNAMKPKDLTLIKQMLKNDFLNNYDALSDENKRAFWRKFIDHIEMDDQQNLNVFFL